MSNASDFPQNEKETFLSIIKNIVDLENIVALDRKKSSKLSVIKRFSKTNIDVPLNSSKRSMTTKKSVKDKSTQDFRKRLLDEKRNKVLGIVSHIK